MIGAAAFDAGDLPTGLYPFTLLARSIYPTATYDAEVSDTLIIVNRAESAFGAGWYLAGVEQLVLGQPGGTILWGAVTDPPRCTEMSGSLSGKDPRGRIAT